MSRRLLAFTVGVLSLAFPQAAFAFNIMSSGGFLFDPDDRSGALSNGSIDAYDGCYNFSVTVGDPTSGAMWQYSTDGSSNSMSLDGRQLDMPLVDTGLGVSAERHFWVPTSDGDYGRFVDAVTNTSTAPITVTLTITGNLGSDSSTQIFADSSGGTSLSNTDEWFATWDTGPSDPPLAHIVQGTDSPVPATMISLSEDNLAWNFTTTLLPGERAAIMTLAIQKHGLADVTAEAMRIQDAPDNVLVGLDDFFTDMINYRLVTANAPLIQFAPSVSEPEGTSFDINVAVSPAMGSMTTPTWTWDLNGDGTFGDMPNAASVHIDGSTTDGPSVVRVGVEATDSSVSAHRYHSVSITNVAPSFTHTTPPSATRTGAHYMFQPSATDIAGTHDSLRFALVNGPSGMSVDPATGLVLWTPRPADATMPGAPLSISISVNDGDGGMDTMNWLLTVIANNPPTAPLLVYPTGGPGFLTNKPNLIISNGTDSDFDPLTYTFEIDALPTFNSPALITSPDVAETPATTEWTTSDVLAPNHWFWRARTSDSYATSDWTPTGDFYMLPPPGSDDAGMMTTDMGVTSLDGGMGPTTTPKSGCSIATGTNRRSHGELIWFALAAAAVIVRRRVRR